MVSSIPNTNNFWLVDGTLIDTTTLGQDGPRNNGNKGILTLSRAPEQKPLHRMQFNVSSGYSFLQGKAVGRSVITNDYYYVWIDNCLMGRRNTKTQLTSSIRTSVALFPLFRLCGWGSKWKQIKDTTCKVVSSFLIEPTLSISLKGSWFSSHANVCLFMPQRLEKREQIKKFLILYQGS